MFGVAHEAAVKDTEAVVKDTQKAPGDWQGVSRLRLERADGIHASHEEYAKSVANPHLAHTKKVFAHEGNYIHGQDTLATELIYAF